MSLRKNSLICFPSTQSFSLASSGNWHDDDSLFENSTPSNDESPRHSIHSSSEDDMDENVKTIWSRQDTLNRLQVPTVDGTDFKDRLAQPRSKESDMRVFNCKVDYNVFKKPQIAIPSGNSGPLDLQRGEAHCPKYLTRERRNTYDMLPRNDSPGTFRQRSSSGNLERHQARTAGSGSADGVNSEKHELKTHNLAIQTIPNDSYLQSESLNLSNGELQPLILEIGCDNSSTAEMIRKGLNGLKKGYMPWKVDDGSGGTYCLRDDKGRFMGIFKPEDEEVITSGGIFNFNGIRKGVRAGEGAVREVLAYMLDHKGFAGVPATALVHVYSTQFVDDTMPLSPRHHEKVHIQSFQRSKSVDTGTASKSVGIWKTGSLQVYTSHDSSAEDVACSMFPVQAVHRIAILDIRLINTDRHCGNILLNFCESEGTRKVEMVPIDHGLCLPDIMNIDNDISFAWMEWPQSKEGLSAEEIEYVEMLDILEDLKLARSRFGSKISEKSLLTLQVGTTLLKLGVRYKLTLYEIGCIICGSTIEYPFRGEVSNGSSQDSPLNRMIKSVASNLNGADMGETFVQRLVEELELYMMQMHA